MEWNNLIFVTLIQASIQDGEYSQEMRRRRSGKATVKELESILKSKGVSLEIKAKIIYIPWDSWLLCIGVKARQWGKLRRKTNSVCPKWGIGGELYRFHGPPEKQMDMRSNKDWGLLAGLCLEASVAKLRLSCFGHTEEDSWEKTIILAKGESTKEARRTNMGCIETIKKSQPCICKPCYKTTKQVIVKHGRTSRFVGYPYFHTCTHIFAFCILAALLCSHCFPIICDWQYHSLRWSNFCKTAEAKLVITPLVVCIFL